jgi:hypothetical protein
MWRELEQETIDASSPPARPGGTQCLMISCTVLFANSNAPRSGWPLAMSRNRCSQTLTQSSQRVESNFANYTFICPSLFSVHHRHATEEQIRSISRTRVSEHEYGHCQRRPCPGNHFLVSHFVEVGCRRGRRRSPDRTLRDTLHPVDILL